MSQRIRRTIHFQIALILGCFLATDSVGGFVPPDGYLLQNLRAQQRFIENMSANLAHAGSVPHSVLVFDTYGERDRSSYGEINSSRATGAASDYFAVYREHNIGLDMDNDFAFMPQRLERRHSNDIAEQMMRMLESQRLMRFEMRQLMGRKNLNQEFNHLVAAIREAHDEQIDSLCLKASAVAALSLEEHKIRVQERLRRAWSMIREQINEDFKRLIAEL